LRLGAAPYSATGGSDCCDAISQEADYPRRLAAAGLGVGMMPSSNWRRCRRSMRLGWKP